MGYTTDFTGSFTLDKPLTVAHKNYLEKFSETRRMNRDITRLDMPTSEMTHVKVGLPNKSEYFVDGGGYCGQAHDESVIDYNDEPDGQPSLWCQWVPTEDGDGIKWNGSEKFYAYVEWIKYLIQHFIAPWGYTLNGTVDWQGEESDDMGRIVIKDNVVKVLKAKITYEDED